MSVHNLGENTKIIYTDGSNTEGGMSTGVGIIIQGSEEGFQISINKKCSVFTAELLGIELALGLVIEERVAGEDILVLTDSRSAVESIENNELSVYKSAITMKIRDKINRIQEDSDHKHRIVVAWILGTKEFKVMRMRMTLLRKLH